MYTSIVQLVAKLARTKTEYDIIPHVDSEDHDLVQEIDESFGICSCAASSFWKVNYDRLIFEGSLSIDVSYFLLLFVPSCLVVWNRRKSLVESGSLSQLEELAFTSLILRRHPRATEPLQQRQWIMQHLISSDAFDLSTEIDFCELLADKHRCNYAAWDYRRWLLKKCLVRSPTLVHLELSRHLSWLSMHPTDASGWSYRAHLLETWREEQTAREENEDNSAFLAQLWQEAKNVDSILHAAPENEPVWMYRRLLDALFVETADSSSFPAFDCLAVTAAQQSTANPPAEDDPLSLKSSIAVPDPFSGAWASTLYSRHIHWLRETILPRLSGSSTPAICIAH